MPFSPTYHKMQFDTTTMHHDIYTSCWCDLSITCDPQGHGDRPHSDQLFPRNREGLIPAWEPTDEDPITAGIRRDLTIGYGINFERRIRCMYWDSVNVAIL